jgi:HK97 family phage major capsid protein
MLLECRSQGREMNAGEQQRFTHAAADIAGLDSRIDDYRGELQRVGTIPDFGTTGRASSAGRLAPLGYADEQLRRAFEQVGHGETAVLETRDFATATGLIPPELGPVLPVFPAHEQRLLAKLPGIAIDVPAISYVEVTTVTGSAGIVAEGAPKPELIIPGVQKVATARKIAAHVGVSWEAYSGDYPAFVTAVQTELMGKITDAENAQLYGGTGEANSQVNGLTTNPAVLTLDASLITTQPGPWDAIEQGIELLRSGPALAEPDLALCHPSTWSAIRRVTNTLGNYMVSADPSTSEVNTAWGVPVLVSTAFTAGKFVLVDTSRYGRVVVRESLVTRIGYSGSDFTENIIRFVSEERLTQTIERPQAICVISGLSTAAVAETTSSKRSSSK